MDYQTIINIFATLGAAETLAVGIYLLLRAVGLVGKIKVLAMTQEEFDKLSKK